MPTNELEPFSTRVLLRFSAGKVIARLGAGRSALLERAVAAYHDQRPGVGKIGVQRLDGEGVDGAGLYAAVPGSGLLKKGVWLSRSSAWAFFNRFS